MAWFENRIYVVHSDIKIVRVFADQAPFNELPEGVVLKQQVHPYGIATHAPSRSIYISDINWGFIWKLQFPQKTVSRISIRLKRYKARNISVTPNDELLVLMSDFYEGGHPRNAIELFKLSNFTLTKSFYLPREFCEVMCAVQSPNKNIIVSYSKHIISEFCWIGILSADGDHIRTFDSSIIESVHPYLWYPHFFTITDDGDIVVISDTEVFWFNSQLTDYRIISNRDYKPEGAIRVVYVKEKQQLLVLEARGPISEQVTALSVYHLSPCSLLQPSGNEELLSFKEKSKSKRNRLRRAISLQNISN